MGIGGSLLYTAQGSFVALNAPTGKLGMFNGIFFAIYMMNYAVGGLITQFVLDPQHPLFLTIVLTAIGGGSAIFLFLLHQVRGFVFFWIGVDLFLCESLSESFAKPSETIGFLPWIRCAFSWKKERCCCCLFSSSPELLRPSTMEFWLLFRGQKRTRVFLDTAC